MPPPTYIVNLTDKIMHVMSQIKRELLMLNYLDSRIVKHAIDREGSTRRI